MKLLLVEDGTLIVRELQRLVRPWGSICDVAEDGRMALALGGAAPKPAADPAYSAVLQRQPIAGIRSPQGLSCSADSRTLITVPENEQAIAELDRWGRLAARATAPRQGSWR